MGAIWVPEKTKDLIDVAQAAPSDGQILTYDAATGKYEPQVNPKNISMYIPGDMFVTTGILRYVVGSAKTILKVRLAIASAPSGADLIIDVNKNGTTMFSTQANRPTIVANTTTGVSVAPDITVLAEGDVVSIDIDQVGSILPGTDLAITIICA